MWLEIALKIVLAAAGALAILAVIFGIGAYAFYRAKNPRKTQTAPIQNPSTTVAPVVATSTDGDTPKKKNGNKSFDAFVEAFTLKRIGWGVAAVLVLAIVVGSWISGPQDQAAVNRAAVGSGTREVDDKAPTLAELQKLAPDDYVAQCSVNAGGRQNYQEKTLRPGERFTVSTGSLRTYGFIHRGPENGLFYQVNNQGSLEPADQKLPAISIFSLTFENASKKDDAWVGFCGYTHPS